MVTFTAATINDDFTDRFTSADVVDADIKMFQEARETNLRAVLDKEWGVHQDRSNKAKAGSAVVWRRGVAHWQFGAIRLGTRPRGARMMSRYLAEAALDFGGGDIPLFIACHRPPKRYAFLWPFFDGALARRTRRALNNRRPVIVGIDANQRNPQRLARKCGLFWKGIGIDGFLVSPGIKVTNLERLPKGQSDHYPVRATFTV